MRMYSLRVVIVVGVVGCALGATAQLGGAGVPKNVTNSERDGLDDVVTTAKQRCAGEYSPQALAITQTLSQAVANSALSRRYDTDDPESWTDIHADALADASLRRELMDRFVAAEDADGQQLLGQVLSSLHRPDVLAFAFDLARSDASRSRALGFGLLAGMGVQLPEVRQIALEALESEADPTLLGDAIRMLQPAVVSPGEADAILVRLEEAATDPVPSVRARALGALAGWDKSGAYDSLLVEALHDPSDEVRWSALDSISTNRVRSPDIKQALLEIATGEETPQDLRLSATRALEHIALDEQEASLVSRIAVEADRQLYDDPGVRSSWPDP